MILSCQHHTQLPIFLIFSNFMFLFLCLPPSHHYRSFHLIKAQHPLQFMTNPVLVAAALKICVFLSLLTTPGAPVSLKAAPELPQAPDLGLWWPYLEDTLHNVTVWDQPGPPSSPWSHLINAPPLHQLWLQTWLNSCSGQKLPAVEFYPH